MSVDVHGVWIWKTNSEELYFGVVAHINVLLQSYQMMQETEETEQLGNIVFLVTEK